MSRTLVTEAALREQLRPPRPGARVTVPAGAGMSPAAADFVAQWRLEVVEEGAPTDRPAWDHAGAFPVVLEGPVPTCECCGTEVRAKPSHLTQVDAEHFGAKNSPRMRLRGKLDSALALTLLAGARASTSGSPGLARSLATIAAYCREIVSAEYQARAPAALEVGGMDADALRAVTHDPQGAVGIDHLVPGVDDPEAILWLNALRCAVREAEIAALDAYPPEPETRPERLALAHALNRLSSAVYALALLCAAGRFGGPEGAP